MTVDSDSFVPTWDDLAALQHGSLVARVMVTRFPHGVSGYTFDVTKSGKNAIPLEEPDIEHFRHLLDEVELLVHSDRHEYAFKDKP